MSHRKRKREIVEENFTQGQNELKKVRKEEDEHIKKFLSLAASEDTLVAGLTYFLTTTKQEGSELLKTYLESHADCEHLLALLAWERERRNQDVVLLCFQCLEQVLLFTASPSDDSSSNHTSYVSLGTNLVHTILNNHMRCIYSSLVTTVPMRLVASCLRLLTAMVAQGPNAAREVQRMFNFGYKPLEVFPTRTHIVQGLSESVRMCFLKFVLSFLVVGDHNTVADILQHKGFLSSFFKLLPQDTTETVQLFLSTLLQEVVLEPKVSKKAKSIFFNQYVLKQVAQLLTLGGKSGEKPEEVTSVRMLVFEILCTLCTDFQLGVCYKSKEPPKGLERTNNPVILHLLLSFTGSLDDPLIQEIIIKTLSTCPDVMISYLKSLNFNFEPQPNSKWVSGMEFWTKLYSTLPDLPSIIAQGSSVQPCSSYVDIAVGLTVPHSTGRHAFSLGLQHTLPLVKFQALLLMEAVLNRAGAVIEKWGPACKSLATLDSFLVRYCDSILKSLPDLRTIISLRQQLLAGSGVKTSNTSLDNLLPGHHLRNTELLESPSLLVLLILKVMRGYQKLSPVIFMQADFSLTKLLPPLGSDDQSLSDSPEVIVTTLKILTEANTAGKQMSGVVLSVVLGLMMSEHENIAREAHVLTLKLMDQIPLWSGNHEELEMVLSCMKSHYCALPDNRQTLLKFMSGVLLDAIRHTTSLSNPMYDPLGQPPCGDGGHEMEVDHSSKLSLEDVLVGTLVIPDCTTCGGTGYEEYEECNFTLATHMLKTLIKSKADSIIMFVGEVMVKLLLAQPSNERCECFASLVIQHLECQQLKNKYLKSEWKDTYLDLLKYINHWSSSAKASTILAEAKQNGKRRSMSSLLKKYGSRPKVVYPLKEQDPLVTKWLVASPSSWDMSDLALNELIDLSVTHSCDELDSVTYLYLKKHIAVCPGWTLQRTVRDTQQATNSCLVKSMVVLTDKLTSSTSSTTTVNGGCVTPWWCQAETKTMSVGGGISRLSQDPALQGQLQAIFNNLKQTCSGNKHALRLFESPLFHYFLEEENVFHAPVCLHEHMINRLLNYVTASVSPVCANIAMLLIESSEVARELLESNHLPSMCQSVQSDSEEESMCMIQIVSKLLEEIVAECTHADAVPPGNHKKAVKYLFENIWTPCLMHVTIKNPNSLQVASAQVIKHLCVLSRKGFRKFMKTANQWLLTTELTRLQLALCCEVACNNYDCQFSSIVIKQGIALLSQLFKESATNEENTIVKLMIEIIDKVSGPLALELDAKQWNEFVHHALRQRFTVVVVLKLLSRLILVVYSKDHRDSDTVLPIPLGTVYEMIWSHSEFLCTINSSIPTSKGSLVELMVLIAELMPLVCDSTHVGVLLSSYFATRNSSDRGILYLLHLYETNGAAVGHHRPFLWGSAAAEQYRLKQETGSWLLWKQPGSRDVIDNFDKKMLKLSTENFPLDVMLKPANAFLESSSDVARTNIYDPCFLLPLMSHVLDTSCVVDCRQFVDHGCLSYLILSLCSYHEDVRTAGGHALTRYLLHLEGSKFKEKAEIYFLLKVLRNSIDGGVRLSSSYGAFLAKSTVLLLHPDNPLYSVVSHFLVYKPALTITDLPLHNVLLHSSSTEHFHERAWMLKVLANGLRSVEDIQLYTRKGIFAQVMALYGAALLDKRCMINCFELMEKASNICTSKAASVRNNAIITLL